MVLTETCPSARSVGCFLKVQPGNQSARLSAARRHASSPDTCLVWSSVKSYATRLSLCSGGTCFRDLLPKFVLEDVAGLAEDSRSRSWAEDARCTRTNLAHKKTRLLPGSVVADHAFWPNRPRTSRRQSAYEERQLIHVPDE